MSFYQVVLNGNYAGQDIKNILWYRNLTPFATGLELLGLMDALTATVRDQIWRGQAPAYIRGRGLADVLPVGYTMQNISVLAYAEEGWQLLSDSPYQLDVNEPGLVSGATNGPASCVVLKANLEPSFGPGIGLPKRGYLAIGPLLDADVADTGSLTSGALASFAQLGNNLATNIVTTLPAAVFAPVRMRITRVLKLIVAMGFKDVSDFTPNPVAKFRRSRLPEA